MPKSAGEGYDYHVVAVRLRIVGTGNFKMNLSDLDDVQNEQLLDLPLQSATRFEPMRLSNIQSQRIRLTGQVIEIDEWFTISKIWIFAKPVAVEYPMVG